MGRLRLDREKLMKSIKKYKYSAPKIQKKLSFGLFFIHLSMIPLWAEIPVALLKGIQNNSSMVLNYRNMGIVCEPFGIKPLEIIQKESANQDECSKAISNMYRHNPFAKHFAKQKLHLEQTYHFGIIEKKCILYGNGPESYSEMLLSEGLAVIDDAFNNKEWNEKLKRAYARGEKGKKGIHAEGIDVIPACIEEKK